MYKEKCRIYDEQNGLSYVKNGDYYVPEIKLTEIEIKELGKYGRMRRTFLQEEKPMVYDDLVLTEQLFPHLYEVQECAANRVEVIMEGLLKKNPAPEKEQDVMTWTKHMNMQKAQAEEVVMVEIIFL